MRKILAFVAILVMSILASTSISTQTPNSDFTYSWIGCAYRGTPTETEPFYGETNVVAYEEGSKAILSVTIIAGLDHQLNVSSVRVTFDWADGTYNGTYADEVITPDNLLVIPKAESRIVGISFTVPSTSIASNLYLHSYTIFVEHLSATSPPAEAQQPLTKFASNFAVYSADQADARELKQVISRIEKNVPVKNLTFESRTAKLLVYKAKNETGIGDEYYRRGEFATAAAHYDASLFLYTSAYSAEETKGTKLEDLEIRETEARISNIESWASMVSSMSTTSILLGVATVLFGIGYIIKQLGALKKPESREVTE